MNLSPNFTLEEFLRSDVAARRGIDMTPPPAVVESLRALCLAVLEPLRRHLGVPITISSGYRTHELNAIIGGSARSQHVLGQAADLVCAYPAQSVFDHVLNSPIPYDQLILEFGWVHISHNPTGPQRRQALVARLAGGGITYDPFRP